MNENFKRLERERLENRKTIENKSDLIEKLKKENHDMSVIINTDQFKTVRTVEVINR